MKQVIITKVGEEDAYRNQAENIEGLVIKNPEKIVLNNIGDGYAGDLVLQSEGEETLRCFYQIYYETIYTTDEKERWYVNQVVHPDSHTNRGYDGKLIKVARLHPVVEEDGFFAGSITFEDGEERYFCRVSVKAEYCPGTYRIKAIGQYSSWKSDTYLLGETFTTDKWGSVRSSDTLAVFGFYFNSRELCVICCDADLELVEVPKKRYKLKSINPDDCFYSQRHKYIGSEIEEGPDDFEMNYEGTGLKGRVHFVKKIKCTGSLYFRSMEIEEIKDEPQVEIQVEPQPESQPDPPSESKEEIELPDSNTVYVVKLKSLERLMKDYPSDVKVKAVTIHNKIIQAEIFGYNVGPEELELYGDHILVEPTGGGTFEPVKDLGLWFDARFFDGGMKPLNKEKLTF